VGQKSKRAAEVANFQQRKLQQLKILKTCQPIFDAVPSKPGDLLS